MSSKLLMSEPELSAVLDLAGSGSDRKMNSVVISPGTAAAGAIAAAIRLLVKTAILDDMSQNRDISTKTAKRGSSIAKEIGSHADKPWIDSSSLCQE
jgi:hypothetical protein